MLTALAFLSLVACQTTAPTTPTFNGKVVDIWGHPVDGATVVMDGQPHRSQTDGAGRYQLPILEGTHKLKAGKAGYIQEHAEAKILANTKEPQSGPVFELYPKPPEPGYFAVSTNQYIKLMPQTVSSKGTALKAYRGISSPGEATTEADRVAILFHTDLRIDEIMRLGLELRKLKYIKKANIPGVLKEEEVSIKLYVDQGRVPIELTPMHSDKDYLITPKEQLEPGVYALQTQQLLTPGKPGDRFDQIPEELRVVFPVQVK